MSFEAKALFPPFDPQALIDNQMRKFGGAATSSAMELAQVANTAEEAIPNAVAVQFVVEICRRYREGFSKIDFSTFSEEQKRTAIHHLTSLVSMYAILSGQGIRGKESLIVDAVESLMHIGTKFSELIYSLIDWVQEVASSPTLSRRDFLKLSTIIGVLTLLLSACNTIPEPESKGSSTPVPLQSEVLKPLTPNQQRNAQVVAMTYAALTRIPSKVFAGIDVFGTASPKQTEIILNTFTANDGAVISMLPQSARPVSGVGTSIPLYDIVPAAECADARICGPSIIRVEDFPDVFTYSDAKGVRIPSSRSVGTQPTLFEKGTKYSMFVVHRQNCLEGTEKCGLLDGIRVFLSDGGEEALLHHNVPRGTIEEIKRLIALGNKGTAEDWAFVGAKIQAALNNHPVLIAIKGHADNTFIFKGVALPDGRIVEDYDQYKTFKAIAQVLNKPHLEASALFTQKPENIYWSFSRRFTPDSLLGQYGEQKGKVFVQSVTDFTPGKLLTDAEIEKVLGGGAYGAGYLPNEGVLTIVADNLEDLARIEAKIAANPEKYGLTTFFKNKGVLIKLIPDNAGGYALMEMENEATFAKLTDLQKAATLGRDGQLTYEIQKGGQTFKQLGLTDSVVIHLERVLQVRLNAGLISNAQFEALIKFTKGTATTLKIGAKIFEVVGLALVANDLLSFVSDNVLNRGRLTSELMPVTLSDTRGFPVTSFSINRQAIVDEHAAALRAEWSRKNPAWHGLKLTQIGKLLRVSFPTRGIGTDTIATGNSSEVVLIVTSSPFKEINKNGDLVFDRFDSTNPKQTVSFVDPNGNFIRSDKESETIVASFNSEKPGKLNYWKLKVVPSNDPKVDSTFQFTFIKTVDIDTKELAKNLSALGVK